ncbi:hypothetical protein PMAYCL1PPCAC_31600, partial [Pristionchus mayeri]
NDPPTQKDLWDLRYYYNAGRVLHAFAATPEGVKTIQNNGIGYSSKADGGSLGATLSDDGFTRLEQVCSDAAERKNIVKLWFTKSGQAYQHTFEDPKSADAVYVGYVSRKENSCGAKWPKKRWASAVYDVRGGSVEECVVRGETTGRREDSFLVVGIRRDGEKQAEKGNTLL